jgi:hypothetical protein
MEVANALLTQGYDEERAIRIAIAQAKRWGASLDGLSRRRRRPVANKEGDRVRLLSRNQIEPGRFPAIAAAVRALHRKSLLLDGEVVVLDRRGVSRFQLLQASKGKALYAVFYCLFHDGTDLRAGAAVCAPLRDRACDRLEPDAWCPLRYSQ